ncbi:AraC family transcriptional regulator [Sedimentitalea arenosa]|jgi:AraC-like DNA-binding protein|uniref:Helix-turn-helix domain-containing protein n=1 Tax=Sedimentitalea arenosa TaxID=2798803 RepID=A0A8J7IUP2_9RHOB|nr:AraC family transcriptional regulator [Arenibacterium arenosum]MBJ6373126.1 helix-turn-helix domain-containing protein [Arenibacterium arenosum]
MTHVPLVRAVHLNIYLGVLREIGEPVDRLLNQVGLPGSVEESPNAYLLVPQVLALVSACGGSHAAMHLGFRAAQCLSFEGLRPETQVAFLNAPSGRTRLEAMVRRCSFEDSALVGELVEEGRNLRVRCDMVGFEESPALAYSEWIQIYAFISAVRSIAGADWCPEEISLATHGTPPDAASAALPNTRILMGQPHCSILVPIETLARPCNRPEAQPKGSDPEALAPPRGWTYGAGLREMLKPYMSDAPLDLAKAAEMLDTTARTLQRRLDRDGMTFRQVLDEARYEIACDLLADRAMKIIDVSFATGYENPQHFTRAFRRLAGISPRDYRKSLACAG